MKPKQHPHFAHGLHQYLARDRKANYKQHKVKQISANIIFNVGILCVEIACDNMCCIGVFHLLLRARILFSFLYLAHLHYLSVNYGVTIR